MHMHGTDTPEEGHQHLTEHHTADTETTPLLSNQQDNRQDNNGATASNMHASISIRSVAPKRGYKALPPTRGASSSEGIAIQEDTRIDDADSGRCSDDEDDIDEESGAGLSLRPSRVVVEDQDAPVGTVFSSSVNITNTILGAGMLAMPSAIATTGLTFGTFLIAFSATCSALGLHLLTCVATKIGRKSSFAACAQITFPSATVVIDAAIAVKCFGVSVSYLVICGDLMPSFARGLGAGDDSLVGGAWGKVFWVTLCTIAIAPVAFFRRLDSLRYTSGFALSAVVYLVFVVVLFYSAVSFGGGSEWNMPPPPDWSDIDTINLSVSALTALPLFAFAFTCHQNIFAVYNEMEDNSGGRVWRVIRGSVGVSVCVYVLIGCVGYLTFGSAVKGKNIMVMYPPGALVTGGQLAISMLVLLSYPLQCHPARASIARITSKTPTHTTHTTITLLFLVFSYMLAISVSDLSVVLGFVGATGSTTVGHLLPGLFYARLRMNESPGTWRREPMVWAACGLVVWGAIVMVTSLVLQGASLVRGGGSVEGFSVGV